MGRFEVFEGLPKVFNFNVDGNSYAIANDGRILGADGLTDINLAVSLYSEQNKRGSLANLATSRDYQSRFKEFLQAMTQEVNPRDLEATLAGEDDSTKIKISRFVLSQLELMRIPIIGKDLGGTGFSGRLVFLDTSNGNVQVYRTLPKPLPKPIGSIRTHLKS